MNNAFGVLLFLSCLVLAAWYGLKFFDWIHAVRYEWRRRKAMAINQAFADGYHAAMGEYADAAQRAKTYKVVIATPDRPSDPIRQQIDALTGKAEAVNYPRGS